MPLVHEVVQLPVGGLHVHPQRELLRSDRTAGHHVSQLAFVVPATLALELVPDVDRQVTAVREPSKLGSSRLNRLRQH